MDDDFENMCPLCVLPFGEQDLLFRPCGCGFRICSWCWHKIVDSAGEAGESTVDTVAKCPNCREPFDVEATNEQQAKNMAIIAQQNKSKPKRKAVPAKQGVVDNVYVDGKSVVLRNVPSDTFFPLILRRLRDKHVATYEKEIAATHGADPSSASAAASRKKSNITATELDMLDSDNDDEDETFAAALVDDSSDEDEDINAPLYPPNATNAATASSHGQQQQPLPQPFPFATVPPCRNKKDIAEVLKSIVLADHLTAAEDQELIKLIVDRRNDFPYQHVYSLHTDRLEHLAPFLVAPTLEQLQKLVGVPAVEGSVLPNGGEGATTDGYPTSHHPHHDNSRYGASSASAAAGNQHSPITTGYPPRAPTLGRHQLQLFSRYESDLWSWVEHFLTPPTAATTTPSASADSSAADGGASSSADKTTVTSSVPYWNHRFFDSWVPADASSRTARRALLSAKALSSPLLPPPLADALATLNAATAEKEREKLKAAATAAAVATVSPSSVAASAAVTAVKKKEEEEDDKPEGWEQSAEAKGVVGTTPPKKSGSASGSDDDNSSDDSNDDNDECSKHYRLLRAVAAPPLFSLDDAIASLTVEQIVADLPVLTYSAVEQIVSVAIASHKVRGANPTVIGGFVSATTIQPYVPASRTNANATALSSIATASGMFVMPTPAAILSSVLIILLHRRRQWFRWVTELIAAADNAVREAICEANEAKASASSSSSSSVNNNLPLTSDRSAHLKLQHLLPRHLRDQQTLLGKAVKSIVDGTAAAAAAANANKTPVSGSGNSSGGPRGILDRGASTPQSASSAAATPTGGAVGSSAVEVLSTAAPADLPASARLETEVASKAYLLTFGIALINYLGIKEGVCLTDHDRLRFLRSYGALGRYGTITDMDIYLQECQLLLNVKPDVKQYRKALQQAVLATTTEETSNQQQHGGGGGGNNAAAAKKGAGGGGHSGHHHTSGSHHGGASSLPDTSLLLAENPPKERKWPEELMRSMLFRNQSQTGSAADALLLSSAATSSAAAAIAAAAFSEIQLLPCQYYWIALRFNAVGEAVQCVLKGTEEVFPSWLGYSSIAAAGGKSGEDEEGGGAAEGSSATAGRSPGSGAPTAGPAAISLYLTPTKRVTLTPRRPTIIGLVPTRYCGSYLKHAPCRKHFCVELHNDVSGKNAIMLTSSNTANLAKAIQKHFFTPYLEAEGVPAEAISTIMSSNNAEQTASASNNNTNSALMLRQGSSSTFLLSAAATNANAVAVASGTPLAPSTSSGMGNASSSFSGACSLMERQNSSVVFGAAAAVVGSNQPEVKTIAPLHLKMIKACDISPYGGDLLVTSPLLLDDTTTVTAATASSLVIPTPPCNGGGSENNTNNTTTAPKLPTFETMDDADGVAVAPLPLRSLLASITAAFAEASMKNDTRAGASSVSTTFSVSTLAANLLAVVSSIIDALLSQDTAAARQAVNNYTSNNVAIAAPPSAVATPAPAPSNGTGGKFAANKAAAAAAMAAAAAASMAHQQQQHISFVSMQLSALAFQVAAGATGSEVTSASLGGGGGRSGSASSCLASSPKKVPSAWLGIAALLSKLVSADALPTIDLFKNVAGMSSSYPSCDEKRALLLAILPEVSALLHAHLEGLLLAIDACLDQQVHATTIGSNQQAILDKAAASAASNAAGGGKSSSVGGLTVLRNGGAGSLQQLLNASGSTSLASANQSGSEHVGGGGSVAMLSSGMSAASAAATTASLSVAIRLGAVPPAPEQLQWAQTAFVTLTRALQIFRLLADTLALSATLVQLQQSSAAAAAANGGDDSGSNNANASAELTTAKGLVQRANFMRVLFSSLQLYLQTALEETEREEKQQEKKKNKASRRQQKDTNGDEAIKTAAGTEVLAGKPTTTASAAAARLLPNAVANAKIKSQLVQQSLKTLQTLIPHTNLVPNTDDREILVNNCTILSVSVPTTSGGGGSSSYGGYHHSSNASSTQIQQHVQPSAGAHEVHTADALWSHQSQLQLGVTPSSAISSLPAGSNNGRHAYQQQQQSGAASTASSSAAVLARGRNAGNALMALTGRRAKRSRRQLANALEMWSVFVPNAVIDMLDDDTREDWLRAHLVAKQQHQLEQQRIEKALLQNSSGASSALAIADSNANANKNKKKEKKNTLTSSSSSAEVDNEDEDDEFEELFATTPQQAVKHALAVLLLPHQMTAAVRYWSLCNTLSAAIGTSGVSVGSSSMSPSSLLTVGLMRAAMKKVAAAAGAGRQQGLSNSNNANTNLLLGENFDNNGSNANALSNSSPHAMSVESRLYADGLAWLRAASGTIARGELSLYQQVVASGSAVAVAAAAEQQQLTAINSGGSESLAGWGGSGASNSGSASNNNATAAAGPSSSSSASYHRGNERGGGGFGGGGAASAAGRNMASATVSGGSKQQHVSAAAVPASLSSNVNNNNKGFASQSQPNAGSAWTPARPTTAATAAAATSTPSQQQPAASAAPSSSAVTTPSAWGAPRTSAVVTTAQPAAAAPQSSRAVAAAPPEVGTSPPTSTTPVHATTGNPTTASSVAASVAASATPAKPSSGGNAWGVTSPAATVATANTSAPATANAWGVRSTAAATTAQPAWGAADLPSLGGGAATANASGSGFVAPPVRSFASIVGTAKK